MTMLRAVDQNRASANADRGCANSRNHCGLSVSVILSDGFSMLTLGSITEALHLAERQIDRHRVKTTLFGFTSAQIRSRSRV